jgi:hypothetical protein
LTYLQFTIANENLEITSTDKYGFLNWLWNKFEEKGIDNDNTISFKIDKCLHCKIGNPVILLDGGKFPIETTETHQKEKLGLMLEFEGDMVSGISICGTFLRMENPFNFERKCPNPREF